MSNEQNEERKLENAQQRQGEHGAAESNPRTKGPAENLREKAAMNDSDEDKSKEPA